MEQYFQESKHALEFTGLLIIIVESLRGESRILRFFRRLVTAAKTVVTSEISDSDILRAQAIVDDIRGQRSAGSSITGKLG